jgi:signal transduction histidine kinase
LEVDLRYAQDLMLRVRDNGIGIDPEISHYGRDGHYGLQGMRERAARIGARFTLVTAPSSGTEITLTVPGGIVFRNPNAPRFEFFRTFFKFQR